ncbi:MAG: Gfo/Idh/MocA family oxidoreductase [Deltaproteobacteria bacterium]|jgi:UDP-2-acetamido-3-amino-2,3-dideoxy-glucuronate N-acetyltransferase|nr:Gfo/Idh/MocA family oxidoreductase [Deltaproteobacteria bacterium]
MSKKKSKPAVAVLGAGYWGRNLVRDFWELGALKAVYDPDPRVQAELAVAYPGLVIVDSTRAILGDEKIQALAIATPAPTHAALTLEALAAGKDVLVEKPLALSVEDGEAMVAEAKRRKRILMVDHLLNRHPAYVELKKMARGGALGRILTLWSRRHNFGRIRKDENVSWSFAPHDVAMILGLVGQSPLRVEATGAAYLTDGVEDIVEGALFFPDNVTAHLSVSWLSPNKEQRLAIVGTKKMATFDDTAPWEGKLVLYDHKVDWKNQTPRAIKDEAGRKIPFEPLESLKEQCRIFLGCVESRSAPSDSDGAEALEVMKVLLALDQALKRVPTEPAQPKPAGAKPTAEAAAKAPTWPSGALPETPREDGTGYFAHPTAVIEPGAKIGSGCKIWHFSHVLDDTVIGPGTNVGQNVVIGPGVKVGAGCKIQNNVSVYKGVELEDFVFCGPSCVFTNVVNPRAFVPRMDELRPTLVGRGTTVGANATIVCGHTLGRFCLIGAGAVVTSDVPDYALMVGVPAKRIGWVCQCGVRLPKDLVCPSCGQAYRDEPARLTPLGFDLEVD